METETVRNTLDHLNGVGKEEFERFVLKGGEKPRLRSFHKTTTGTLLNLGFDTEDDSNGNCHLLVFSDGTRYFTFNDPDKAIAWLLLTQWEYNQVCVWCINTEYDLNNLVPGENRQYLLNRLYNKSRFILARPFLQHPVRFYDLINFYSLSAEKVGELFGLKKLHFQFEHKYRKNGTIIVTKKEVTYCQRDSLIAYTAGKFITDKFIQFNIRQTATVASSALQIWLKNFDPLDITKVTNLSKYTVDPYDIYKAYFGGRVECFRYGWVRGNLHYYDVNSLYPFVMKNNMFPNPVARVYKRNSWELSNGLVHAQVKVPKETFCPVLPVKHQITKDSYKLIFPVGTFSGWWTVPELQYAVDQGVKVLRVYQAFEWSQEIDLFSDFIEHFYTERMTAKLPADKYFYKVIMNSLYGKFAEKRRATRYVPVEDAGVFDPIVFDLAQTTEEYLPDHNNVIVSAYVTSYARIHLHKLLKTILDKGLNLLYCDTDSVIYQGTFELPVSNELGDVKKESDIVKAEFLGAKWYRYLDSSGNWHFVCKGVPRMYQEQMFTKKCATYKRPIRYREAIRRHLKPNVWVQMTKQAVTTYDKRTVLSNGHTTPIVL